MIEPQQGDLFLLRRWPVMNHVAIYLGGDVYEAWPPVVRRIEWKDFAPRLEKARVTVLRNDGLHSYQIWQMTTEAELLLGEPYNWLTTYWFDAPGWHCWKLAADLQTVAMGLIYGDGRLSSVSPRIGRRVSLDNGWRVVG